MTTKSLPYFLVIGLSIYQTRHYTKMFIESSRRVKSKILSAAMEVDQDYRRFARVGESILLSPQKIAYS